MLQHENHPPPTPEDVVRLHRAHRRYVAARAWERIPQDRPLIIQQPDREPTGYLTASSDAAFQGLLAYYAGATGLYAYSIASRTEHTTALLVATIDPRLLGPQEASALRRAGAHDPDPYSIFRSVAPIRPAALPDRAETHTLTHAINQAIRYAAHRAHLHPALLPPFRPGRKHPFDSPCPLITISGTVEHVILRSPPPAPAPLLTEQREAAAEIAAGLPRSAKSWHVELHALPATIRPPGGSSRRLHHPMAVVFHPHDDSGHYLVVTYHGPPSDQAIQEALLTAIRQRQQLPPAIESHQPVLLDALIPVARVIQSPAADAPARSLPPPVTKLLLRRYPPPQQDRSPIARNIRNAQWEIGDMDLLDDPRHLNVAAQINPLRQVLASPPPHHADTDWDRRKAANEPDLTSGIAAATEGSDLNLTSAVRHLQRDWFQDAHPKTATAVTRATIERDPDWTTLENGFYRSHESPVQTSPDAFQCLTIQAD